MNTYKIYCGDCLKILPTLPKAKLIFADPPDNIGLKYDNGLSDKLDVYNYYALLRRWINLTSQNAEVIWWSINHIHESCFSSSLRDFYFNYEGQEKPEPEIRKIIWHYTFGQHNSHDLGNCYRPIFRVAPKDFKWNVDAIRVQSMRQKTGDNRANPKGRVPSDVWSFPRVCGTHKERRKYHPCQHPEALIERIILMSTNEGDLVIDPFGGTFTTLRVCQRLKRDCISIDISESYCNHASQETGVEVERITGDMPLLAGGK